MEDEGPAFKPFTSPAHRLGTAAEAETNAMGREDFDAIGDMDGQSSVASPIVHVATSADGDHDPSVDVDVLSSIASPIVDVTTFADQESLFSSDGDDDDDTDFEFEDMCSDLEDMKNTVVAWTTQVPDHKYTDTLKHDMLNIVERCAIILSRAEYMVSSQKLPRWKAIYDCEPDAKDTKLTWKQLKIQLGKIFPELFGHRVDDCEGIAIAKVSKKAFNGKATKSATKSEGKKKTDVSKTKSEGKKKQSDGRKKKSAGRDKNPSGCKKTSDGGQEDVLWAQEEI